jgi:hypothetical protein
MRTQCSWCGVEVEADDGFRAYEPAGDRAAAFCRLEHLVPWAMQGAHWEAGAPPESPPSSSRCAECDAELGDLRFLLVHHRGAHRITDEFCSVEHLRSWAAAGGRWR